MKVLVGSGGGLGNILKTICPGYTRGLWTDKNTEDRCVCGGFGGFQFPFSASGLDSFSCHRLMVQSLEAVNTTCGMVAMSLMAIECA